MNIEKILEDWEPHHALREVIANALDEQLLSETNDIEIFKDQEDRWHVRDYGRGLNYMHLTQKENKEKLKNENVIGKFGIGLKDALATFDRHKVKVYVKSKYGDFTLGKLPKADFKDIKTLHACIEEPSDPYMIGTDFVLDGIYDYQVAQAKKLFLKFSGETIIESTKFGDIIEKRGGAGTIYINGVKASEETNFLFSYNITSLNAAIKKALNRERTNVGRSAYTDRVKAILLASESREVALILVNDLQKYSAGDSHDELSWLDVQVHTVKILNQSGKVIFASSEDLINRKDVIDQARNTGYKVITIPENLRLRVSGLKDFSGATIVDTSRFVQIYNESFEFKFVDVKDLTKNECAVFSYTDKIFTLMNGRPRSVLDVKISETMRKDLFNPRDTNGVWEPSTGTIIIKRSQLKSLEDFSGSLLHEALHAKTGLGDLSRDFEMELSTLMGIISARLLRNKE